MSKEIIELLEKTNIRERADDIWAFQKEGKLTFDQSNAIKRFSCLLHDASKKIERVLTLLKPPECSLCGDKKVIPRLCYENVPCPDCQEQIKQQPTAGEFTKEMREKWLPKPINIDRFLSDAVSTIAEACDRLDRAEAENRQLKGEEPIPYAWWKDCPKLAQKVMERLIERNDRAEAENRRLKKAIEDYGNNPAGFDWAVLEKIENQEATNKDLLDACKAIQIRIAFIGMPSEPMNESGPDWSKEIKLIEAAIAKAKKEG